MKKCFGRQQKAVTKNMFYCSFTYKDEASKILLKVINM